MRNKVISNTFIRELQGKHDVVNAVFLIDGDHALNYVCERHELDFKYERHRNRNSIEPIFR